MIGAGRAFVIAFIVAWPVLAPAQQKRASELRRSSIVLPPVMGGVMRGREIEARLDDGRVVRYTMQEAEIIDGRLRFSGALSGTHKAQTRRPGATGGMLSGGVWGAVHVSATLVGTTARATNPIPRATDASAPRRNAQPATGERNEQTQSLYAPTEAGSGCELVFLKVVLGAMEPVQLGVVLAHQDNQLGEEINRAICRVKRALDAEADTTSALDALNQLLKK